MSSTEAPLIMMVAGELSGDQLGAGLIRALKRHYPKARFAGIGGPAMIEAGLHSFFPMERLSVMGLFEVLGRLRELLKIRSRLAKRAIQEKPAVFIGIDAPDFNLSLELTLRQAGIPTVHYVSPSVWAWRQKRVHKIRQAVDLMLTLLPFEADFYRQYQVPVAYVGHRLAHEIPFETDQLQARRELGLLPDRRTVAVLPGSRANEVKLLGPAFIGAMQQLLQQLPTVQFVIPAANEARHRQIETLLAQAGHELPVTLVTGNAQQAMIAADVVLIASGTATLEAALLKRPMVAAYKFSTLTYEIMVRLVKSKFYTLPNLIADEYLVPEIIQREATPERLAQEVLDLLQDARRYENIVAHFDRIHRQLACDSDALAAEAVVALLEQKHPQDGNPS